MSFECCGDGRTTGDTLFQSIKIILTNLNIYTNKLNIDINAIIETTILIGPLLLLLSGVSLITIYCAIILRRYVGSVEDKQRASSTRRKKKSKLSSSGAFFVTSKTPSDSRKIHQ